MKIFLRRIIDDKNSATISDEVGSSTTGNAVSIEFSGICRCFQLNIDALLYPRLLNMALIDPLIIIALRQSDFHDNSDSVCYFPPFFARHVSSFVFIKMREGRIEYRL
jgi:hypothetical protein